MSISVQKSDFFIFEVLQFFQIKDIILELSAHTNVSCYLQLSEHDFHIFIYIFTPYLVVCKFFSYSSIHSNVNGMTYWVYFLIKCSCSCVTVVSHILCMPIYIPEIGMNCFVRILLCAFAFVCVFVQCICFLFEFLIFFLLFLSENVQQ